MRISLLKCLFLIFSLLQLASCGGGGGSAGTVTVAGTTSGTSATTTSVALPTISVTFVNGDDTAISTPSLSQTTPQYFKIVVKKATGAVEPYARVSITLDDLTKAVLVPDVTAQLADVSGVLKVRVAPKSVSSTGAVVATFAATVDGVGVTSFFNLSSTPGTVAFTAAPTVSLASLQVRQSLNVSVITTVNGAVPASNSVAVTFSSTCGTVEPASALVDNTGKASAVLLTTNTGSCTVTASASGATSGATPFTVNAAPTTGIQFVSAAPTLIYQAGSTGVNNSLVTFKVINSTGGGVSGQNVTATLTNTDGGINFCGSPSQNGSTADGTVVFSVCGGTLPATVQILATLDSDTGIKTTSNILTVQTGLPTQRFFDISATKLNFFAGGLFTNGFNGNTTDISVFAADRLGNPVPNGTSVIFVAEGGQLNTAGNSSCILANGRCTVSLIGQAYRPLGSSVVGADPRPGRVTVLAYTDGEESFTDANNNNRYDTEVVAAQGVVGVPAEKFEDLGTLYLDKDDDGVRSAAYTNLQGGTNESEQTFPMPVGSNGNLACLPSNTNPGLSVVNSCNQTWDGKTKVRRKITIVFSGDEIGQPSGYDATIPAQYRTQVLSSSTSSIRVQLADLNGNPLPSDAVISAITIPTSNTVCIPTITGEVVGNTREPSIHAVSLAGCVAGNTIRFKATAAAKDSFFDVQIP